MLQVRVIVSIKPHECSPLHPSLLLSTHLNPPQPHRDPDAKPTLPHPLQKAQPTSHQLTPTPLPLSLNPPLLLHLCLHWFHLSHSLREDSKKLLATTSHSLWLTAIPTLLVAWHWHRLTTVLGEPPQQKRVWINGRTVEVSACNGVPNRQTSQWVREGLSVCLLWGAVYTALSVDSGDVLHSPRVLQAANGTSGTEERSAGEIALDFVGIILLICLSGLFSGLTLGLMSLDKIGLEIVIGGEPDSADAKNARKIQPIREHGNLLLCTLLFGNTLVNAALSVLLASYTGGIVGTIVSTFLIFFFGELMPQATCSRHALYIGSRTVWLVRIFMVVFYVIVKPISMILDCIFKEEIGAIYSSSQLSKLLDIHVKHEKLDAEQAKMMGGAMDYKDKRVESVMTPKENIFMLSGDTVLDFPTISKIFHTGYSRIPVYHGSQNNIVGLLFTKDLIVIDPEESTRVSAIVEFFHRPVHWLWPDTKLSEALKLFKSGRGHLALVRRVVEAEDTDPFYEFCGLITLEDIIEEIIGDEIVDETDCFVQVEDDSTRVDRSTFDFARLKLLDPRRKSELTEDEVNVVCAHLSNNVPEFASIEPAQLQSVVKSTPVLEFKQGEMLYRRDKPITHFTLCLSGKLQVTAGTEGFISEAGPWSCLGKQALLFNDGEYLSDFTATVISESLRCIRLSKRQVDGAKKPEEQGEPAGDRMSSKVATSEDKPGEKVNGGPHEG